MKIVAFLTRETVLEQTFNRRNNNKYNRKTDVLESLFNNVVCLNFIKKRIQHRCFPVNFSKIFKNTYSVAYLQRLFSPQQ